jgi:hypothetical protein
MRNPLSIFSASLLTILTLVSTSALATSQNQEGPRAALVIGNGDYQNGALRNPVNDARAVAAKLEKLGFQVILRENMNREGMHQAISAFSEALEDGGVGLFYYAGHGMQIKGRNFLIPVDADIQYEDDIEFGGIDANMVLSRMEKSQTRVNLVVLDACRNNPFGRASRSAVNGLAHMDAPKGTLIAFSTSPGSLAKDGSGSNSVYTKHLIEKLSIPALPVEQVFKEVRIAVTKETNDRQIPWESSSLMGDFYFVPPRAELSSTVPVVLVNSATPQKESVNRASVSTEKEGAHESVSPAAISTPSPKEKLRDYNREGYEIEIKAKHLTKDEMPALENKARKGDVIAQTTLGWAYLLGKGDIDGRGIPRSNPKMVKWTRAAAKQGYPVAQNNFGAIYMDGVGVELDYTKAKYYFRLSADQGYATAHRNLFEVSMMLGEQPDKQQFSEMVKIIQQGLINPMK